MIQWLCLSVSLVGLIILPEVMDKYYKSQKIVHFRKKSGRVFTYEPLRHFI